MNRYKVWLYLQVKRVVKSFISRLRTENGMKLNAFISSLYNVYIRFGAEFTISGLIRTSSIFPDPYMKTSIAFPPNRFYLTSFSSNRVTAIFVSISVYNRSTTYYVKGEPTSWTLLWTRGRGVCRGLRVMKTFHYSASTPRNYSYRQLLGN